MGIRYYAYAFDASLTEQALGDPHSILSSDPLADAWGFEPHASIAFTTFEQAVPKRDMLYLDKAWSDLQDLTATEARDGVARPSFRMFEGNVTMRGWGWDPWVRVIVPSEVPSIRDDLNAIADAQVRAWARGRSHLRDEQEELQYVLQFLSRAREFVDALASDGRGMVYLIG
jgi:hypothetical protein